MKKELEKLIKPEFKTNPQLLTLLKALNNKPKSWEKIKEETNTHYLSMFLRSLDALVEYKLAKKSKKGYKITSLGKKFIS